MKERETLGRIVRTSLMNAEIQPERFTSCGFLYNPKTQSVFLHLRDGNTLFYPNCWAFFGGKNEDDESPEACYIREMREEIGIKIEPDNTHFLREYFYPKAKNTFHIFYSISEQPRENFTIGEGADFSWIPLTQIQTLPLAEYAKNDLEYFRAHVVRKS